MIWIRFDENGHQAETITTTTPLGDGWHQAPTGFSWGARYKLVDDQVVEMTLAELAALQLEQEKPQVAAHLVEHMNRSMMPYAGCCLADLARKTALVETVKDCISGGETSRAAARLAPLADLRGETVLETARMLLEESYEREAKFVVHQLYLDKLERDLDQIQNLAELGAFAASFKENFDTTLNGGTANAD
jgi:hypothetical protein